MAEIRKVGIPSPRVEGEEKVGGKALYAVDVVLPNILWVKVLRSPIAHGKIKRIDITEAQRVAGSEDGPYRTRHRRREDRQEDRRYTAAGRRCRPVHRGEGGSRGR